MNYIESRLKEFDEKFVIDLAPSIDPKAVDTQAKMLYPNEVKPLKDFLRTSLEEYRKEFMSCIPEKRSKRGIYGENLATDWTMGFDDARQELLSKISKKGL